MKGQKKWKGNGSASCYLRTLKFSIFAALSKFSPPPASMRKGDLKNHRHLKCCLVAEKNDTVLTTGGMKVIPDHTFESCPKLDILVVPGGWGTRKEIKNPAILNWLRHRASEVETLTSVCTGSMLLGFAGLLEGCHATTHWRSLDWMRESFPSVTVEYDKHVVEDGRIFTSAGISAGIDMALMVVARYCGVVIARSTAKRMEYPYPENNARRIEF